jgi:hypothetical protein
MREGGVREGRQGWGTRGVKTRAMVEGGGKGKGVQGQGGR